MQTVYIILAIVIAIGIFFLCRELNCWYLKINARMSMMENMLNNQKEIIRLLRKQNGESLVESAPKTSEVKKTDLSGIKFSVGDVVKSTVEKYGIPANSDLTIDMIWMDTCYCSYLGQKAGSYLMNEITVDDIQ